MDFLPFELIEMVVSFLDNTSDVASMRSVCRLFKDACVSSSAPLAFTGAGSLTDDDAFTPDLRPTRPLPWKNSTRLELSWVNLTQESAVQFLNWVKNLELYYCDFDTQFVFPANIQKLHINHCNFKFHAQNPLTFQNLTVLSIRWEDMGRHEWIMPDMPNIQELSLSGQADMGLQLPANAPMLRVLKTAELFFPITIPFYPLLETAHCKNDRVEFGSHQPSLKYVYVNCRFPINTINAPLLKELHIIPYRENDWEYNFSTTSFELSKLHIERANVSGLERLYDATCHFESCLFVDSSALLYMKNNYLKKSASKWSTSCCHYYDGTDIFPVGM